LKDSAAEVEAHFDKSFGRFGGEFKLLARERSVKHNRKFTPITIKNIDFTVARQIEQCPKTMMLRELVMNAIEAAARAPAGRRIVEIKGKQVAECNASRKLAIWNTGPGMSSFQLDHICDLAASIGKDMVLEGNFGMGAKVASLPANTHGMRYRSCQNGIVSQVILGKREGTYVKVACEVEGSWELVIDVTEQVEDEGEYRLDEDWTEVVLFGSHPEQDTVADPYNGDPKQDRQWISTNLYHRFYRLLRGVEIYLDEGTHPRDGRRQFKPIPERADADAFGRVETVDVGEGVKIHYYYDPPYQGGSHTKSISGSLTSSGSPTALVFRGEIYDVRDRKKWAVDAPKFGIPFGARHISIHVELPDGFPVQHEPYRRFIQLSKGGQQAVSVDDFTDVIFHHRPDWLIKQINEFAPKASCSTEDLRKELQERLNELRIQARSPRIAANGAEVVEQGGARGAAVARTNGPGRDGGRSPIAPIDLIFNPVGAKRATISKNMERAPAIIPLRDEEQVDERQIAGKAARYYRETNQLFVNLTYSAVAAAQDHLERRYATHQDPELVSKLSCEWAERITMGRVGYAVVYAQAKQLVSEWTPDDVTKALEPECLSLAADGWRDAISAAYQSISRRLGTSITRAKDEAETSDELSAGAVP
jgi:hypothetical protein